MSYLTQNPDLMMEVLAVLVRRSGGAVTIDKSEAPARSTCCRSGTATSCISSSTRP